MAEGPAGGAEAPLIEGGTPDQERMVPESYRGTLIEADHVARYLWAARLAPGKRVLDAACGAGYGAEMLARAGAGSVLGVDLDPGTIEDARRAYGEQAEFAVGDILALELEDDGFDLVVCFEAIEHVAEPAVALDELRRVLAPGGVLVVSTPNKRAYPEGNPYHLRELEPEELEAMLGERFANVRLLRQQDYIGTLITTGEGFEARDAERSLAGDVRRLNPDPREASFVIAVAGDAELPDPDGLAVLTDFRSIRQWTASAEAWIARLEQRERELARTREKLNRAENALEQARGRLELIRRQPPVRALLWLRRKALSLRDHRRNR